MFEFGKVITWIHWSKFVNRNGFGFQSGNHFMMRKQKN